MKNKKYQIILLIAFLVLVSVAISLFIKLQRQNREESEAEQPMTEDGVPDLYNGNIDIEDTRLLRGRFEKFDGGVFYIKIGSRSPIVKEHYEVIINEDVQYDCLSRYIQVGDEKIDRLEMYLDTSRLTEDSVPKAKNLEWFLDLIEIGEAIEVRSVDDGQGGLKPGIIYVYKDTCPAE